MGIDRAGEIGCEEKDSPMSDEALEGMLLARPTGVADTKAPPVGTFPIGLGHARDGLMFVPASWARDEPGPFLLMLHGAGGSAAQALALVQGAAESHGVLVFAPDSRGRTWDVIRGGYGPDVSFIDLALGQAFATFAVDPGRIAVGGFSDGASYALCLGLGNGDLFGNVLAFSPGFAAPAQIQGTPRVFLSHGREDTVLPIDRCGRRVARSLEEAGYDLDYHEFTGGHVVPPDLLDAAFARFLGGEER